MSNVKRIRISVYWNIENYHDLLYANPEHKPELHLPWLKIKARVGEWEMNPYLGIKHGLDRTGEIIRFTVFGEEAVPVEYLRNLVEILIECGATVEGARYWDVEENTGPFDLVQGMD